MDCLTPIKDWTYTILVGAFVASYWRGTWVLLDIWTCDQPPDASLVGGDSFCFLIPAMEDMPPYGDGTYWNLRLKSARRAYLIGLGLLFLGIVVLWSGAWLPRLILMQDGTVSEGKVTINLAIVRFLIVYALGFSAVCMWRGIWYWADAWILPEQPVASYWTTSLVGSSTAFLFGAGNSILAPPAIFLIDGPNENAPPIGVTVLSSYYSVTLPYDSRPPKLPLYVRVLDVVGSFIFLPFAVVWFWRGTWLLLDNYLWGFTLDPKDVWNSKLYGFILAVVFLGITSEPIFGIATRKIKNPVVFGLAGRLRTWILAWGTVSYWRTVWYIWDEFLGQTSTTSAWCAHVISLALLTAGGCVSSINAPASTLGVDAVPNEKCADEPLFAMLPIPNELLYVFAIGRQESARTKEGKESDATETDEVEMVTKNEEQENANKESLGETMLEAAQKWAMTDESKRILGGLTSSDADALSSLEAEKQRQLEVSNTEVSQGRHHTTSDQGNKSSKKWSGFQRVGPDGQSLTYCELQRPNLHSRTFSATEPQRPNASSRRNRSNMYRSR